MQNKLGFNQRFVTAMVIAIHPNSVDFELDEARLGVSIARVYREHWSSHAVFEIAQSMGLFLITLPHHDDAKHWFASIKWAIAEENPWSPGHTNHPQENDEVCGEVASIVNSDWAIVRLEPSGMDAWLHKDAVPDGRFTPLYQLLPLGLRLKAKIVLVEPDICRVTLSVLARIKGKESDARLSTKPGYASTQTPYLHYIETEVFANGTRQTQAAANPQDAETTISTMQKPWHACHILVIDDDKDFLNNLCNWLQAAGAHTWKANNLTHAEQLVTQYQQAITHILLDYHIGTRQEQAGLLKLIKAQKHASVALISGSPVNEIKPYAQRIGMPLLAKPIAFDAIEFWLLEGTLPQTNETLPAIHWQRQEVNASTNVFDNEAQLWLKQVCQQHQAGRALWLRCHRPGYHVVNCHPKLPSNSGNWLSLLQQSLITDAETSGEEQVRHRLDAGRIDAHLWPPGCQFVIALPRQSSAQDTATDDLILLFTHDDSSPTATDWQTLMAWWQTLAHLYDLTTVLQEDQVFAIQGRVHGATLHELRPLMQPFTSPTQWDAATALAWWSQGRRAHHLIEGGLYHIKPAQKDINLRERLKNLFEEFLWKMISRRGIHVRVFLPTLDLQIQFPLDVFEHCLINLVDNATKFCARRRWAHVDVKIQLDHGAHLPLSLTVCDEGTGMTPDQQRYMFLPRHGSNEGFGMGLYVAHSMVKAAGGELYCEENYRWGGCKFICRLPLSFGASK